MREVIFAVVLAIGFLAVTELSRTIWGLEISQIFWRWLIVFSVVGGLLVRLWFKIPLRRIQQTKNPSKWVSAEIRKFDNSQYLMFHGTPFMESDYVDFDVELSSELPFDIEFSYLKGLAVINGNKTDSTFECMNDTKLRKRSRTPIKLRFHNWTNSLSPLYLQISIQLELSGEDTKHRPYKMTTEGFPYGPQS